MTTREIETLLRQIAATGVAPRTVNKARQLICAIFHYGMRPSTYTLEVNPAKFADRRAEPEPAPLAFYNSEQIELLARALATGAHRDRRAQRVGEDELRARGDEDHQDADVIRVAAYTGLRRGELVTLRWRDVDFARHKLTVRRSLSGGAEATSTKSRRAREVPLPDQAAVALDRLSRRIDFTAPDDYVFLNRLGRRLDPTALRRRFERARDAAGLPPLRFHDLRHTYGSLLVAGGIDLVSVKAAMGHSRITTTERYLRARPAAELAVRFTRALAGVGRGGVGRIRVSDPTALEVVDPDGRRVVLDRVTRAHLIRRRPEMLRHIDAILAVVSRPDVSEPDVVPGRERFYRRDLDPRRWLRVVVDFNETPGRVVTAFVQWGAPEGHA